MQPCFYLVVITNEKVLKIGGSISGHTQEYS